MLMQDQPLFQESQDQLQTVKILVNGVVIDGGGGAHSQCILARFTQNKLAQFRCQILGLCCQHPQGQDL